MVRSDKNENAKSKSYGEDVVLSRAEGFLLSKQWWQQQLLRNPWGLNLSCVISSHGHAIDLCHTVFHPLANLLKNCFDLVRTTDHRMDWVGRVLKDHLVPTPCHAHGPLPLNQVAQSLIRPGLKYFQGWGIHSFSKQPVLRSVLSPSQ